jgi:hypothetical protein
VALGRGPVVDGALREDEAVLDAGIPLEPVRRARVAQRRGERLDVGGGAHLSISAHAK